MQGPHAVETLKGASGFAHTRTCHILQGKGRDRKKVFPPPAGCFWLCQDLFWLWGSPPQSSRDCNPELTTELSQKQQVWCLLGKRNRWAGRENQPRRQVH